MSRLERPYTFYDATISLCPTCLVRVEAKIVFRDGKVQMHKRCREHGAFEVLLADDIDYYRAAREQWIKPAEMPARFQTPVEHGCPYDCGLCTDHQQHACLTLIEITDRCNLTCPVCYAESGPHRLKHRSLEEVEAMLDAVVRAEGEPDVVQISGGEPTIHPRLFEILASAKARPIKHLMINTNGVRIANEPGYAQRLADVGPGFEVYLQLDSLREEALVDLRGQDLRDVRLRALDALDEVGLATTLVVTLKRGINDQEIGELLRFAATRPCVRGVTFQPVQVAGRLEGFDPATDRLTLTEVRRLIAAQSDTFTLDDVVPVPCHPDALAMAYALRDGSTLTPLTRYIDRETLLAGAKSTIALERDPKMRHAVGKALSAGAAPGTAAAAVGELLCCLPQVELEGDLGYEHVFRVVILEFLDAWSFDVRSVKRACIQIAQPDGRLIPFDTFNLLYRDGLEKNVLGPLRQRGAAVHG